MPLVTRRDSDVGVRFDLSGWDSEIFHHGDDVIGRGGGFPRSLDRAVADDEQQFMRVGVFGGGDRVECCAEAGHGFVVDGDEADNVRQGVSERHEFGGRLRNYTVVDKPMRSDFEILVGDKGR